MPRRHSPSPSDLSLSHKRSRTVESEVDAEDIASPSARGNLQKKVRWDGDVEAEDEDDSTIGSKLGEKVCMTASCANGRIGCSYYDPVKCIIYILEDTQESAHFDLTKMLLEQAAPSVVLTSSKADDKFMDICREHMDTAGGLFQIRPHKDFNPVRGRARLLSLGFLLELPHEEPSELQAGPDSEFTSEARNAYEFMRRRRDEQGDPSLKRWNASIRMSNFASVDSAPLCVGSMGALLDHLTRERAVGELEDEGIGGLEVRGIEALALDEVMQINADALSSLQVFENESHASIHSDKTKEGLSLFGILNNTRTTLGRNLLRTWLLRPSLRMSVIVARHDAVTCFTRSENLVVARGMHNHLKGIKNIPRVLASMRLGKAGLNEWQGLVKFTFHTAMLRDALMELSMGQTVEVVQKLFAALDIASFKEVGAMVNDTIDWEESAHAGRICVRPHIDEDLDNRKHIYHGIDVVLSKVAEEIAESVPADYATSLNVVYFPQLGFLVCVPMLEEWKSDEGIQVLDGWTFQFSSEAHVYFKSEKMHDLDKHIGDLYPSIVDRELEIIQELQERILEYDVVISGACDICAELDCLLCFAEASSDFDYRRPIMSEENILNIVQGRHPLQEQVVNTFVPNDTFLVGGAGIDAFPTVRRDMDDDESSESAMFGNSVMVCTGANACGKSVYLKQVALIQFMAQIGCFVPADSATLGIVDKIFTRVQTRESVSKVQSAFMIDLNQVSLALRNSTSRSLILLDEFGKGTMSTDGAGLFCGVLKNLLSRGPDCPKVLATTHFHDVFNPAMLSPQTLPISFVHMEVMFTTRDGEILGHNDRSMTAGTDDSEYNTERGPSRQVTRGEKITYLYRVAQGLSLHSHAARCAELFGIPSHLIERAQYVSQLLLDHELPRLLDEEMTDEERRELEGAEEVGRKFLAWDLQAQLQEGGMSVKEKLAEILRKNSDADPEGMEHGA